MKTGKTNSTTNGREETTSKKIEISEMQLRKERNNGCCNMEEAMVTEKGEG